MKRPAIDLGACILCEICVELAPHAFEISDSGFVRIKPLNDYQDDDIHEAMKNCPKDCIFWEDD